MTSIDGTGMRGIEGGDAPSQAGPDSTSASEVSDGPTACSDPYPSPIAGTGSSSVASSRRGSPKLDMRIDAQTLAAVRARAQRLGLRPSTWVKQVVRDALDQRRTDEVDAAVGAALVALEADAQAGVDARTLAAQVRPLAVNVNALVAKVHSGASVVVDDDLLAELADRLREVRVLLGDRVVS